MNPIYHKRENRIKDGGFQTIQRITETDIESKSQNTNSSLHKNQDIEQFLVKKKPKTVAERASTRPKKREIAIQADDGIEDESDDQNY